MDPTATFRELFAAASSGDADAQDALLTAFRYAWGKSDIPSYLVASSQPLPAGWVADRIRQAESPSSAPKPIVWLQRRDGLLTAMGDKLRAQGFEVRFLSDDPHTKYSWSPKGELQAEIRPRVFKEPTREELMQICLEVIRPLSGLLLADALNILTHEAPVWLKQAVVVDFTAPIIEVAEAGRRLPPGAATFLQGGSTANPAA
jgi:hypothetical protein